MPVACPVEPGGPRRGEPGPDGLAPGLLPEVSRPPFSASIFLVGLTVGVEIGARRVFASALEWPGWCRSARTEEGALAALAAYRERYLRVAQAARLALPAASPSDFQVVERKPGNATTDFGAPAVIFAADQAPLGPGDGERLAELVLSAWRTFGDIVAAAPATLRKGPRGGGRDRDQVARHVQDNQRAYWRKFRPDDAPGPAGREEVARALMAGGPANAVASGKWPPRYEARRLAWHLLDHAWEIEDRSRPD